MTGGAVSRSLGHVFRDITCERACIRLCVPTCTLAYLSQAARTSTHHGAWHGLGKEKLPEVSPKDHRWGRGGPTQLRSGQAQGSGRGASEL